MKHTIYILLNVLNEYGHVVIDYPVSLEENIDDIVAYQFEKKYNTKYDSLTWFTYPTARDFVKGLENAWMQNKLDSFDMYTKDYNFIDWLKKRYEKEAMRSYRRKYDEELQDATSEAQMLELIEFYSSEDED